MNATAKFAIASTTGPSPRWRMLPRVEKTNASNAPHGERRDNDVRIVTLAPARTQARLSQIDTARYEPDWNGPRLTAPFVAQVLGQVLQQDGDEKRSALAAYRGETQIACALLCDRRV
jgi:hypothetical protein